VSRFVEVRFFEELNDFLPPQRRKRRYRVAFQSGDTVKAIVESQGVPHTEVDLITVNGESVSFSYQVRPEDQISVYPMFEALDISPVARLRERPLRTTRFLLDVHLGKLARLLRMLGFDARYDEPFDHASLAERSVREHRILLSRDRGLLKRRIVTHGYCVRSLEPLDQAAEVLRRFDLQRQVTPFSRCIDCNRPLEDVEQPDAERLPPGVRHSCADFCRCPSCGKVYWKGTHWDSMRETVDEILRRL
jgi:hypothetical protein